jgi:hypothetical protein
VLYDPINRRIAAMKSFFCLFFFSVKN